MASTNIFNPRLLSSSENDVNDVFIKPGLVGPTAAAVAKQAVSRCLSEPVNAIGKEFAKDDVKLTARTSALSDSSNVRKRTSSLTGTGGTALKTSEGRPICSPVLEDLSPLPEQTTDSFPEPEMMRQRARDINSFPALLEEEENENQVGRPNVENLGFRARLEARDLEEDSFFSRDQEIFLEASRNINMSSVGSVGNDTQVGAAVEIEDEEDDESYPEIEHFPIGYDYCPYGYGVYPYELSPDRFHRSAIPSYHGGDFPELPTNLIKDNAVYPEEEFELDFVEVPKIPEPTIGYEMRQKMLFEEYGED